MEDNRKGTWGDVTEECKMDYHGHGYAIVTHNGCRVAEVGHKAFDVREAKNYRVASKPNSMDADLAGFFKVEKRND